MPIRPRNTATEDQRDVIESLSQVLDVEVKRFDVIAAFPQTMRFNTIAIPLSVVSGGVWPRDDPHKAAVDVGFYWFPVDDGIKFTYSGLTADTMYTVSLVGFGRSG